MMFLRLEGSEYVSFIYSEGGGGGGRHNIDQHELINCLRNVGKGGWVTKII